MIFYVQYMCTDTNLFNISLPADAHHPESVGHGWPCLETPCFGSCSMQGVLLHSLVFRQSLGLKGL